MGAKTLWGVGHTENRFRADFHRPGITPNLGIKFQDAENRRDIKFLMLQPPQTTAQNFGQHNMWLASKYGDQTPKIE